MNLTRCLRRAAGLAAVPLLLLGSAACSGGSGGSGGSGSRGAPRLRLAGDTTQGG